MKNLLSSNIFRQAFTNLKENDPVRMAGATAFFAFFALPSIVIILGQVLSMLFNNRLQLVNGQLFGQLAELFGPQSARQIQDISRHLRPKQSDQWLMLANIAILFLTSTTLFAVMKNSINQLWNVKTRSERVLLYGLKDRGVALTIIFISGLLFTASVAVGQALSEAEQSNASAGWGAFGYGLIRVVTSLTVLTLWFAMLFAYLPDVRTHWRAIWVGAGVTSGLFTLGELLLTRLLTYSQIRTLHGGAGAITLVLLFVFYCSLIFYYGASFTRQYAKWANLDMEPGPHAVGYTITEVNGDA